MSGSIKDVERSHSRLVETLNRKHEREVARMNEVQSQNKTQLRKHYAQDLVDLQEDNDRQITEENDRKDRVLSKMKGNLDESKRLTDKELKELADYKQKETNDLQLKFANDRERIAGEHNEHLSTMNDRYNQATRRVNLEGQDRVDNMNHEQTQLYSDRQAYHQRRLDAQHTENTQRFRKTSENNLKLKNQQVDQFEKERMDLHRKQDTDIRKMTEIHGKHYKERDEMQRGDLKNQDLFFEKRYAETYKRHNEHFKVLDGVHDNVVKKLEADLTKEVEFKTSRQEDPFFQFVELKPTLTHTETGVKIEVKVPDHSKQDLQLNLNGKEAVVNFNRRYIDTQKDAQGNSSRVSKIETLSTRLQTGVHLDPKSLKSSWKDGIMTYEIKKA